MPFSTVWALDPAKSVLRGFLSETFRRSNVINSELRSEGRIFEGRNKLHWCTHISHGPCCVPLQWRAEVTVPPAGFLHHTAESKSVLMSSLTEETRQALEVSENGRFLCQSWVDILVLTA